MSTVPAVPPADAGWLDVEAAYQMALGILRLSDLDPDAQRVHEAAEAACQLVAEYLDLCGPWETGTPVPAPITQGCGMATVDLYRRKDAPFGVLNAWSPDDIGALRIGGDWMSNGTKFLLLPYKCAWGIA